MQQGARPWQWLLRLLPSCLALTGWLCMGHPLGSDITAHLAGIWVTGLLLQTRPVGAL